MRAGKTLMQWSKKGPGRAGTANEDYRTLLKRVKQGVNEAVLRERVPPGYRAMIQRYFDRLPVPGNGAPAKPGDKPGEKPAEKSAEKPDK